MAKLLVTPEVGLADDHVHIKALGLQSDLQATIRLTLKDEKGQLFQSRAFYKTDKEGQIDMNSNPALGGSYQGVEPMGLIWSLKPIKPFQRPVKRDITTAPFLYKVDLFDSISLGLSAEPEPICSTTFSRWHMAPDVKRIQIREGSVRGTIFFPTGEGTYPGIIDMYGGGGGLAEYRASLLASRKFVVFALAYFGYEDLQPSFQNLHLEYFEQAANLLLSHPKVAGQKIGVLGVSKGAEIALVLASFLPQIGACISINGTSNVFGSTIYHKGKVLIKGATYKQERMLITDEGVLRTAGFYEPHSYASIPVEKSAGHILFLAGKADQYYNSEEFAAVALYRMRKNGHSNCRMIIFPGAGHLIEPPGFPFSWASYLRGQNLPLLWGGEMIPHCKAEDSIWKEIQIFFRQNLCLYNKL
ncbi:acyl-coenzyme A amino acid N-acyltransferase 2-like [Gastrophryne carolinensis]